MKTLNSVIAQLDTGVQNYGEHESSIETYFHEGVVPSTMIRAVNNDDSDNAPEFDRPDPISVLNVACKIHLESVEKLVTLVGEDPDSVAARSKWTKRLELWAAKAFEDSSLFQGDIFVRE